MRIAVFGYGFAGIGITLAQALNGAGSTKTPLFLDALCFLMLQIPLAYYMGMNHKELGYELTDLWWVLNGVIALAAVLYTLVWWRGAWKEKEVQ